MKNSELRVNRNRVISAYEVYYRRDGEKRSVLANSKKQANRIRDNIINNKRKFLGVRPVRLVEVIN